VGNLSVSCRVGIDAQNIIVGKLDYRTRNLLLVPAGLAGAIHQCGQVRFDHFLAFDVALWMIVGKARRLIS
jgi:hypothetical protein